MQTSTDAQHFFETDAAQEQRERRSAKSANKYGNPVVLKSKVLAVLADPTSPSHVFVAESAGAARQVNVDDGDAKAVFRGPAAPVTCLALGGPDGKTLFAGTWDRAVWSWHRDTRQPGQKYVGHSDFVKAVVCGRLGGRHVLISGGADKKIIVWDVASGQRLHTLQDNSSGASGGGSSSGGNRQAMLAVQDLAIDPVATTADEIALVSASSDPHIRRWRVRLDGWEQVAEPESDVDKKAGEGRRTALLAHQTTVYKLVFEDYNYTGDDEEEDVDLWTSSADGTAKRLSRLHGFRRGVGEDHTFAHGSHVRAVAVTDTWVVTAGRDEDLQYWDRAAVDGASNACYAAVTGHYDEVTGLAVLADRRRLCSVSLDGTVRTWPLARAEVDALVKQQKEDLVKGNDEPEAAEADPAGLMTAEEEAELAALMGDD